jgi:hypothetical protein
MKGEARKQETLPFYFQPSFHILALSDFFLRDRTKQAGGSEKKY